MRVFDRIVTFRSGEAVTAWLMFAYSFLAMTSHNIVKPLTKSKTIAQWGAENLPYFLLGASVLIGLLMHAHVVASRRLPRRAIIPATQLALAALLLAFWFFFRTGAPWVSVAFFVFGLLFGVLMISQFWTLANDIYDPRQARRIFGFIGAGASLGAALGSGITGFTVERIGTGNLVLVSAAVLFACVGIVVLIERRQPPSEHFAPAEEEKGVGGGEAIRLLRESRHLQIIALVIGFAAVGASIIDQQLNMAAEEEKATENAIAGFLGIVTMYLSLVGFGLQLGLTSRIHRSLGLTFALMLLPVSLGASGLLILGTGALWAAALARVLDSSLRYTVDKTTREVLFLPLPPDLKYRAKPFVDVTVDRVAKAVGAIIALVLISDWGLGLTWRQVSFASLAITGIWMVAALVARRGYLQSFRRSLDERFLVPASVRVNVADAATIEALVEGLSNPDETAVLYSIEMLDSLDKRNLITPLLLHHQSARVRERTLRTLETAEAVRAEPWVPVVERLLTDADAGVRAAAVRALAVLRHHDRHALMRSYLDDDEPRVVVTAAAELADSGDADDARAAEAALARLVADTRRVAAPGRRDAAVALGRIRQPSFRSLLVLLLHDPDVDVAREAMASANAVGPRDPLFLPALVARLGHRELKAAAREAITTYGDDAIGFLAHVLADRHEHVWVRRHVPATLARMPSQQAMDALFTAVHDPEGFVRFKAIQAIVTLRRAHPSLTCPAAEVEALVVRETGRYWSWLSLRANFVRADPLHAQTLVVRALDDKLARALDRVFRLLGLLYPWKDVAAAREGLERGDARTRVSALEYLDNLLGGTVRKRVMPLVDEAPLEDKLRHAHNVIKSRPRDVDDTLAQLIHDDDPVLAAAAVHFVRSRPLKAPMADDLEYVLDHLDVDPLVRDAAASIVRPRDARTAPLAVVQVVDRLRAIPLFAFVSVDELFRIAAGARQVPAAPGEVIARQGEAADAIHFLIDGTVTATGDEGREVPITAPAALDVADVLDGRPASQTITAGAGAITMALPSAAFWTVLADDIAIAQGLFRMLLAQSPSRAWAAVHQAPPAGAAEARPLARTPMDTAARLRHTPLFGRASVDQLVDLVAITHEVRLTAGTVLLGNGHRSAVYHLLHGEVRIDRPGDAPVLIGPGSTIGVAETLTDTSPPWQAIVTRDGQALRLDHRDVFEVLADHTDLLQGVFSGALEATHGRMG